MAASVRIEDEAFADVRIELLGELAGYNRFEALGRMAHLWRLCTQRHAHVVSEAMVMASLGPKGVDALLGAELGERVESGIRIKGTEGRIEWLEAKKAAARAGGEANRRRLAAIREPSGYPEGSQAEPRPSPPAPAPAPAPAQNPENASRSARARSPVAGTRARPKGTMPDGWAANDTHRRIAAELSRNLEREVIEFCDDALANGRVYANWDAAFCKWLRNERYRRPSPVAAQASLSPFEAQMRRVAELEAEERRGAG